eukprot:1180988-Prorocentrum_minimum.AAC.6
MMPRAIKRSFTVTTCTNSELTEGKPTGGCCTNSLASGMRCSSGQLLLQLVPRARPRLSSVPISSKP